MSLLLNNSSGQPSTTRTVFLYGSIVCVTKLALSGMDLHWITIPVFSGSDFGIAIAALGSIYGLNKHVANLADKE